MRHFKMDPTIGYITARDSFASEKHQAPPLDVYVNSDRKATFEPKIRYSQQAPAPEYVTITLRKSLDAIKKSYAKYDPITWNKLRKEANPFELPGNSIFINRAAVKLANIDAVYGLTPNVTGAYTGQYVAPAAVALGEQVAKIPQGKFTFADLAGGPGSFSQYILFRQNGAVGYGITLADPKDPTLGWEPSIANAINVIVGDDGSGDLFKHSGFFGRKVLELNGEGVDLVVADGSLGEENVRQEVLNFGLIVAEVLSALICLKEGGSFVCKIFEAETKAMAQLIYLLSLNFQCVDIFKPIASRPANAERYLVCLKRVRHRFDLASYLQKVLDVINSSPNMKITRILNSELPIDFVTWLTKRNDVHTNLQISIGHYIEHVASGNTISKYNMYKAYMLWNIPDSQEEHYKVVRKTKYYKYEMDKVEEIDTLIFKELKRYQYIQELITKIANALSKYHNRGGANTTNAIRFLSMYMIDHLSNEKYHPLDPVFPSGSFINDDRYYDYLTHTTNGTVDASKSKEWFISLELRKTFNMYANRLSGLDVSSYRYNIKKEVTDKGIKYVYYASAGKKAFTISQHIDIKLNQLLQPAYQSRAKEYIFLLLLRYIGVLNSGNHQLAIPDYDVITPLFNIKEELFASPLNCTLTHAYHSAFPDIDKYFGSLGTFNDTKPVSGNGYTVNPPYTDIVMELAMVKVVEWLRTIPNLVFYITIPVWGREEQKQLGIDLGEIYPDYKALTVLKKSGFIKAIRTYHRDVFKYIDYNTDQLISAANTHIIIASNRELNDDEIRYMETR